MNKSELAKVVFLGACEVGKTSLVDRLLLGTCVEHTSNGEESQYSPTTENWWTHRIQVSGKESAAVQLVDTTGAETDFGYHVRNMHIVFGQAFVVVFSVKDHSSFDMAVKQLREVIRIKKDLQRHDHIPLLLVGNLSSETAPAEGRAREISVDQGRDMARSFPDCLYRETSNLSREDVHVFNSWILNQVVLKSSEKSRQKKTISRVFRALRSKMAGSAMVGRSPGRSGKRQTSTKQSQRKVASSAKLRDSDEVAPTRQEMFGGLMELAAKREQLPEFETDEE